MLLRAGVHHADLLRHLGWTGGFIISSSTYSGHFGVTSRPGMGAQIESQFWESPSFGLLQQINQVLLITVFFACLGSFFPRSYYSGLSVICTQVYQMVAALTTVAWRFGQFPYIVQRTPHPDLGPTYESRLCHAITASRRRPAST